MQTALPLLIALCAMAPAVPSEASHHGEEPGQGRPDTETATDPDVLPNLPTDPDAEDPPRTVIEKSTREQLGRLAGELKDVANRYGPDAVTLQVGLLAQTIRAGAVGPSEAAVVGPSADAGAEYLRFNVITGMIFDSTDTTPRARLHDIWSGIVAPAFEGMESFNMEPKGIELALEYGLQDLAVQPEGKPDPAEPYDTRTLTVVIAPVLVGDYAAGAVTVGDVLDGAKVRDGDRVLIDPGAAAAPGGV